MSRILSPVGSWDDPKIKSKRGNQKRDVTTVQKLLIEAADRMGNQSFNPGKPNGLISKTADRSATLKAIGNFQARFLSKPDRRVDVGGKTIRKLSDFTVVRQVKKGGLATVIMTNTGRRRNLPITDTLMKKLGEAVGAVFGSEAIASVYSGGQPAKGTSTKRIGSVRHDLGHAADITIVRKNGKKVQLAGMEILGQWWLANECGCAGVGMQRGRGIHLDEWNSTTGPKLTGKMGPYWIYASGAGASTRAKLRAGTRVVTLTEMQKGAVLKATILSRSR